MNFKIHGEHDEKTIAQMALAMDTGSAAAGVLCADGHFGYGHPIGGVIGYRDHISVSGVGFDIACGNMAVKLDTRYDDIKDRTMTILRDISKVVSFGVGRTNSVRMPRHPLFDMDDLWKRANAEELRNLARDQLGTVGSGNHYVDLFEDGEGFVWIGVHFGSRGLGHKITTRVLGELGACDSMEAPPALVVADSALGLEYQAGIELGGLYAYAGREWVVETVRNIIGGAVLDTVHNHHNFMWREEHGGEPLYVVRKGATPAFHGQRGFVGGSMGDNAVILQGVDGPEAAESMHSTVHGAGRIMSRTDARGKKHRKTGEVIRLPRVDRDEWRHWLNDRGVTLIGADLDEAPQAYRRLPAVLAHHAGTIEVLHTLRPFGVIMAHSAEHDPYKD